MRRTTPVAIFLATSLFLAGCGASGGSDSSSGTTATTKSSDGSDGTTKDTTTKDTTTTVAPRSVSTADLKAILPTADDIGPDYTLDETTTGSDSSGESTTTEPDTTDKAMREACPELDKLDFGGSGSGSDDVTASFKTEDDRGMEVSLDPTPKGLSEEDLDKTIDAFNACKEIKVSEQGTDMVMTLKATKLEGVGDYGINLTFELSFQMMGSTIGLRFHGYLFAVDGVDVSVMASSGLDAETMAPVDADEQLVEPLAAEMEKRVKNL